ncbi:MAG: PQQ-binding-like beta-propeller repeat protein [Planctomycetota bacterium]
MMNGQRLKRCITELALVLLVCVSFGASGADKKEDKEKPKAQPQNPADLFKPTPALEAQEAKDRDIAAQIADEVATREVPLPPQMNLDLDWYSPHLKAGDIGRIIKGWVKEELILLETDKHYLYAINRADGMSRWTCQLDDAIRYAPCVSRNNVVVNVNNHLVAIEKNVGEIRWRLLPKFVMSCEPLVIDPAIYPKEYTKNWQWLENIYVGGWDGRFYCLQVRGRMSYYIKHRLDFEDFAAPEFDIFSPWHKTHRNRGIITTPIKICDSILYYTADDQQVYGLTRDGNERDPYFMLAGPTTSITVTGSHLANITTSSLTSIYVGAGDNNVYCLDRLTLKKKWAFPAGYTAINTILADEPSTPLVYTATSDGLVHALQVTPIRLIGGMESPETYKEVWTIPASGAITVGPSVVYLGLDRETSFSAFKGIQAVDKATGKALWKVQGPGFLTHFLEFHNSWSNPTQNARVFAITTDNRVISLKEKVRDTGIKVVKATEPPQPKAPVIKKKAAEDAAK